MASILRLKKCKICHKPKKFSDDNNICKECQEKSDEEKNICIKCKKVSKDSLNEDKICIDCIQPAIEEVDEPGDSEKDSNSIKKYILLGIGFIVLIIVIYFVLPLFVEDISEEEPIFEREKTVKEKDTVPNTFSFTNQNDVGKNITIESNEITVFGIDSPTTIKVKNGDYSINENSWTDIEDMINNEDRVKVRHQTSGNDNGTVVTRLDIGTVHENFITKTKSKKIPLMDKKKEKNCSEYSFNLGLCSPLVNK